MAIKCEMTVYKWIDYRKYLITALDIHLKTLYLVSSMDPRAHPSWILDSVDKTAYKC